MKKSITISGVEVTLIFTFYTYKLLGEFWKKETIQEVMEHVVVATSGVSEESLSFQSMEVFSDIVQVLDETKSLTERQIQDYLFSKPEDIALLVQAFTESLSAPNESDVKKKNPAKK